MYHTANWAQNCHHYHKFTLKQFYYQCCHLKRIKWWKVCLKSYPLQSPYFLDNQHLLYTHSIVWIPIPLLSKDKGTVTKVWRLKISQIVAMTGTALSFFICRFFFDSSLHLGIQSPCPTLLNVTIKLHIYLLWIELKYYLTISNDPKVGYCPMSVNASISFANQMRGQAKLFGECQRPRSFDGLHMFK